ncbi:glycosyl hydrolase [Glacieibacterium sp.]|uniref:glycosyl hydrolase n=1 Tax=Glacieibacterium sp. TaxID=2860237 RepID=UPI003B003FBC
MSVRCIAAVALLGAVQAHAAPPFPLGTYVGNAHGNDAVAMAKFKAAMDAHSAALGGAKSKFFNVFTDYNGDPSTWAASAGWAAWSSARSGDDYVSPGGGAVPVVGVPMAWPKMGFSNVEQFYIYTAAGSYDAVWAGIVDAWADNGYKIVDFRIAYEMNGNYMPWSPANASAPTKLADFVKAFQRVADVIHAEARKKGITALVHWNPTAINWTPYPVTSIYPGDAYVDVISIDQYSPMYPLGYVDWTTGGNSETTDKVAWAAVAGNRQHYYRYPNATRYVQTPGLNSSGWSMPQAIEFAKLHGKPIAVDETGVGKSGAGLGPSDDPEFPKYLAGILTEARSKGVAVRSVNIWDAKLGDGDWDFRGGSKPLTAAAWRTYFGEPRPNP